MKNGRNYFLVKPATISSMALPFVSGKKKKVTQAEMKQMTAKIRKDQPWIAAKMTGNI